MPASVPAHEVEKRNCPVCSPLNNLNNTLEHCTFNNQGPVLKCIECHCRFYPKKRFLWFEGVYEIYIHESDLEKKEKTPN